MNEGNGDAERGAKITWQWDGGPEVVVGEGKTLKEALRDFGRRSKRVLRQMKQRRTTEGNGQ